MSGTTGQRSERSGVYQSDCCRYEIALSLGETYPPCRECKRAVRWTLVRPTNR